MRSKISNSIPLRIQGGHSTPQNPEFALKSLQTVAFSFFSFFFKSRAPFTSALRSQTPYATRCAQFAIFALLFLTTNRKSKKHTSFAPNLFTQIFIFFKKHIMKTSPEAKHSCLSQVHHMHHPDCLSPFFTLRATRSIGFQWPSDLANRNRIF